MSDFSNLSSLILAEIFATIGLDNTHYELKSNLIDRQLLKNRNNIAHGNQPPIDKDEYEILHTEILGMLDRIFTDISNSAVLENYRITP